VAENVYSVAHGFRLLSSYQTDAGERLIDHHRGGPVGDHAASARRVLTSCRIGPLQAKAGVWADHRAAALLPCRLPLDDAQASLSVFAYDRNYSNLPAVKLLSSICDYGDPCLVAERR
jgi:hypothetical protein